MCWCTSIKQLDGDYEEVGLRHEDVVENLKFTASKDFRISKNEYTRYAFQSWDDPRVSQC